MPRFCTALENGWPCPCRALPGRPFCCGHNPLPSPSRRCVYFTRDGRHCASLAILGQDHCFTHSPRNRRARRPAIPIIPRTRRQRAQAKWFLLNNMPESLRDLLQPSSIE